MTKLQDFEQWLMGYFMDNHVMFKDDYPDAFDDYVERLDPEDWFKLVNLYADYIKEEMKGGGSNC
jgi:hypothetical protein